MSVHLMKNISLWKGILALPVLEKLALDELLSGKILPHLQSIVSDIHDGLLHLFLVYGLVQVLMETKG